MGAAVRQTISHVPRGYDSRETDPVNKAHLDRARNDLYPEHGKHGWTLAKYEWRPDGSARFLYVRNTGERREVHRTQKGWL